MSDINSKCLEVFPGWLASIGSDVQTLQSALQSGLDLPAKKAVAGGINYLFKSLDLVPDGIDDIGYLDDAFVLRMAAADACAAGIDPLNDDLKGKLHRLREDTGLIRELLGEELFARFAKYTKALADGSARGRTVDEIIEDATVGREFASEVADFIREYRTPGFSSDEKNIIKLKAFMEAKLPR